VFIVHLRNVTAPLPVFTETFLDDGYGNIYRLLRSLVTERYNGTVILDHTPSFVASAGPSAATAFAIGYVKRWPPVPLRADLLSTCAGREHASLQTIILSTASLFGLH